MRTTCASDRMHAFILALLILMLSAGARANCTQTGAPAVPSSPSSVLNIPADLPVGAAIPGASIQAAWSWTCTSGTITTQARWAIELRVPANVSAVSGLSNVYAPASGATWPAGIGLRIKDALGNVLPMEASISTATQGFGIGTAPAGQTSFAWKGTIELVKTGPISFSGTSFSLNLNAQVPSQAWGNNSLANSSLLPSWTISNAALKTCTVNNPTQNVTLPTVSQSALTGSYANAGSTRFAISLNCKKGAVLHITMTDANHPGSTYNLLFPKDKPDGIVAVKIERLDGTRVAFGPDSSAAGTVNQWSIGDTPDGLLDIPLIASYLTYSTTSTAVFPIGKVDVAATFTLSYQ